MAEAETPAPGPLSHEAIARIDASLLPSRERHHLRVMAHCLASFQDMAGGVDHGPLPSQEQRRAWCGSHPQLSEDPAFCLLLLEQLSRAGQQLEQLAQQRGVTPLQLTLDLLIEEAEQAHRLQSS